MSDNGSFNPGDLAYYIFDDPAIFCPKLVIILEMMGQLCRVYDTETFLTLMAFRTELRHLSESPR